MDSSELIVQQEEVVLYGSCYVGWTVSVAVRINICKNVKLGQGPSVHSLPLQSM